MMRQVHCFILEETQTSQQWSWEDILEHVNIVCMLQAIKTPYLKEPKSFIDKNVFYLEIQFKIIHWYTASIKIVGENMREKAPAMV